MKIKTLTEKILEITATGATTTFDIITTILESGYGASYSKLSRNFDRLQKQRDARSISREDKHRFQNLISKLKRDGLIDGKNKISITQQGKNKLIRLKFNSRYQTEKDESTKIIIFDIPERNKAKRDWLRKTLRDLGLRMLQKSVWIGKVKIQKNFLRIFDY